MKKNNLKELKNINLTDYYRSDVMARFNNRIKTSKSALFLKPNFNLVFSVVIAFLFIMLFSSINTKNINLDISKELLSADVSSEYLIDYVNTGNLHNNFDLSAYYENLSEEEMVDIFLEMDTLFENNSSYLIENMAANLEF